MVDARSRARSLGRTALVRLGHGARLLALLAAACTDTGAPIGPDDRPDDPPAAGDGARATASDMVAEDGPAVPLLLGGALAFDGASASDFAGRALAGVGDVDGDTLADFVVGARRADPNGSDSGRSYLVYGSAAFGTGPLALSSIAAGSGGLAIDGEASGDFAGFAVAGAGDYNADGSSDLLIGAFGANLGSSNQGRVYIVLGGPALGSGPIQLSAVALSTGGFALDGAASGDEAGYAVAFAGDVDSDGYDDVLVGAPLADPAAGADAGRAYLVYGRDWFPPGSIDLGTIEPFGGLAIEGEAAADKAGWAVDRAGDVNGDGFDDMILGAPQADPAGAASGRAYVVLGSDTLGTDPIDLADVAAGVGGFAIDGAAAGDTAGSSVAGIGDFNGDGLDDVVVGAPGATNAAAVPSGRAYVVFGRTTMPTTPLDLGAVATSADGIAIDGDAANDDAGFAVAAAGDLNEDGLADLLVNAHKADPTGSGSGRSYVVFGADATAITAQPLLLKTIALELGGFPIDGAAAGEWSGQAVDGLGDVDGDGVPDLGLGAPRADPNATTNAGRAYLVFGDPAQGSYHPYNRRPRVGDDTYVVEQGSTVVVAAPGLLANDTDADGQTLTVTPDSFMTAGGATVSVAADGSFSFTPPHGGWWGEEVFTYEASDGVGGLTTGTVRVVHTLRAIPLNTLAADNRGLAFIQEQLYAGAGQAVACIPDRSDDGIAEAVLGAFEHDTTDDSVGRSYVVHGDATAMQTDLATVASDVGGYAVDGTGGFDWAGLTVADAGDFNADGRGDYMVGAIGYDTNGSRSGRAYLVYGRSGTPDDTLDELLTAPLFSPLPGLGLDGEAPDDDAGRSLASAGDIDADGYDDIVIGAYRHDVAGIGVDAGRAYVLLGQSVAPTFPAGGALELADVGGTINGFIIDGEAEGDLAGFGLAGPGDLDNDGYDDLVVGAYGADPTGDASGRTYVIHGDATGSLPTAISLATIATGTGGIAVDGEFETDLSGRALSAAGDVNGDGIADLLVGAPGSDCKGDNAGRAYILFGGTAFAASATPIALTDIAAGIGGVAIDGQADGDEAGSTVAAAGDLNGDGYDDVIVGAPFASGETVVGAGRLYVILGGDATQLVSPIALDDIAQGIGGFAIDGAYTFDAVGHAVAAGRDLNADGVPDILVGTYNTIAPSTTPAYVVFGGDFVLAEELAP